MANKYLQRDHPLRDSRTNSDHMRQSKPCIYHNQKHVFTTLPENGGVLHDTGHSTSWQGQVNRMLGRNAFLRAGSDRLRRPRSPRTSSRAGTASRTCPRTRPFKGELINRENSGTEVDGQLHARSSTGARWDVIKTTAGLGQTAAGL